MSQTQEGDPRQGFLSINEFARLVGVHPQTVRLWDKSGHLLPHHRTPGGQRRYTIGQVQEVLASPPHADRKERRDRHGED